jgi:glycyl-tRNA synthetase
VIWQPYNEKVGAGTMNPATFLRVLGPEPWNVAYVEPSVRPDDGRYGENPNRMQQHYQYQVILKPDPGNPQEIYLKSLAAIGVDLNKHDIRFVEDNWASPALGAWGLGWEVWLDGLEITQFTYFQQAGGISLDPVSVEITYGLDRIAMALNGVQFVGDLKWSQNRSWGDLNLQGEREHSKYYFEVADTARLRQMVELYEAEAKASLEAGLLLPAYDYVLKTSHGFNVLDARGAIGVTERQAYFRRIRALSGQVAQAYIADRQRQEYPWQDDAKAIAKSAPKAAKLVASKQSADFLLEIGTEELPPGDIEEALRYFKTIFKSQVFDVRNLNYKNYQVYATPRRLVVYVESLESQKLATFPLEKGPAVKVAYDSLGRPTKALEGWAKQKGLKIDEIDKAEIDGGLYVVNRRKPEVVNTIDMLVHVLPAYAWQVKFKEVMRWRNKDIFSRPIRWILALYGDTVVPLEYAGLIGGKTSRGLRLGKPESFKIESPKDYFAQLKKQGILLDDTARRAAIQKQIQSLATKAGGAIPEDEDLLNEVTNLVESPTALLGEFEERFLELPREVLIAVMKKHQRYFPVEKNGKLLNKFIVVGNGSFDAKAVTAGNADVIRARFTDAAYFVHRDREHPLDTYLERLKSLTFQKDLGSMWDKTQRISALTKELGVTLNLTPEESKVAQRAAQLAKADLVTKMVVEMTSLQGVMGKYYALDSGETAAVADAIYEHYLPRFAGDETPKSKPGLAVGIADRLDSLAGLFAMGLEPTGAKDPFAQRRAAIGLVQSLMAWDLNFDLRVGIAQAAAVQPVVVSDESKAKTLDFIIQRLRALLLEANRRHDVTDAVLAAQGHNPAAAQRAIIALGKQVSAKDWQQTLDAFGRCVRITRDLKETYTVDESAIVEDAERELLNAVTAAEATKRAPGSVDDFLNVFTPMIPAINLFFDKVLVMAEDDKLKRNRLGLLQRVAALANGVADFSKLEGF